jgi:hypothetical protein
MATMVEYYATDDDTSCTIVSIPHVICIHILIINQEIGTSFYLRSNLSHVLREPNSKTAMSIE